MASDNAKPDALGIETNAGDIETGLAHSNGVKGGETALLTKSIHIHIDEPYMDLREIAAANTGSNINISDVEQSGGLSSVEATERLNLYGKNSFTPPKKIPEWKRFAQQFKNMFMVLLYGCGFLSLIAFLLQPDKSDKTNLYLALVLFVVVILTCWIQFHEEGKAYKIMDSFTKMLAAACTVIRDSSTRQIPVENVVPGDLVLIKDGDKVPADLVLLLCRGLKVECSSLTGESEPIICSTQVSDKETRIFECKNLVFSSSLCFDGMAIGIVVRTGDKTVRVRRQHNSFPDFCCFFRNKNFLLLPSHRQLVLLRRWHRVQSCESQLYKLKFEDS